MSPSHTESTSRRRRRRRRRRSEADENEQLTRWMPCCSTLNPLASSAGEIYISILQYVVPAVVVESGRPRRDDDGG